MQRCLSLPQIALCLTALMGLSGCNRIERAAEFKDAKAMTREQSHVQLVSSEAAEVMGGRYYTQEMARYASDKQLDQDPALVQAVVSLAELLVTQAVQMYPHAKDWNWEIHVVAKDEMNASCIAGGKMQIYTGLIEGVKGQPDKIAAVLGHEIAHALLEHSRSRLTRDWLISSGTWIAAKSLKMGVARANVVTEELNTVFKPLDRQHEREADALGLELMARAGFDPVLGSQIWQDFARTRGDTSVGAQRLRAFFSDHPADDERLARLTQLAQQWQSSQAVQGAKP